MAILKILEYPDPFLAQKTRPVEQIDKKILKLIEDMGETMFDAPGVGLAAPQVGSNLRIIVYNPDAGMETEDETSTPKNNFTALIKPRKYNFSFGAKSPRKNEACLSVPDYSADVKR